jgi:hypothetical protein
MQALTSCLHILQAEITSSPEYRAGRLTHLGAAHFNPISPFIVPVAWDDPELQPASPHGLVTAAYRALVDGQTSAARTIADQALATTECEDWDHASIVHHAHLIRGRAFLADGEVECAAASLRAAARLPDIGDLGPFGPNMRLAYDLLVAQRQDDVLDYIAMLADVWNTDRGRERLNAWARAISAGRTPDFGPNLAYGDPTAP